ncbi:hypothetical protein, partial [Escherichia coli]|uniref:hypothetical protein n=1 Tax=Escherichia coli TaxID=562 RepID=UPI001BC891E2
EQKQAVLARDLNWCMRTGGNIYFLAKIGATDGKSFQQNGRLHDRHVGRGIPQHDGEQKQAVLARDLNWCMRTGGNIYFLAKIGATDGK